MINRLELVDQILLSYGIEFANCRQNDILTEFDHQNDGFPAKIALKEDNGFQILAAGYE